MLLLYAAGVLSFFGGLVIVLFMLIREPIDDYINDSGDDGTGF